MPQALQHLHWHVPTDVLEEDNMPTPRFNVEELRHADNDFDVSCCTYALYTCMTLRCKWLLYTCHRGIAYLRTRKDGSRDNSTTSNGDGREATTQEEKQVCTVLYQCAVTKTENRF